MSLLLDRQELDVRRGVATGPLKDLATSLGADLKTAMDRPLFIPEGKALLSRAGGRCARDGTMLDFDPYSPHAHRCPKCGEVYRGELHDGFWTYWYQLWLAERAVHAVVLSRLGVMPEAAKFAADILGRYSEQYLKYQNVDNALGPTRPFFSTYLESIWLLQLCVAADMLQSLAPSPSIDRFRDAVVEPSLSLIESFDEGMSNRQVWNNAALIAGNRLLGRDDRAESVVWAESGLVTHLSKALLFDGTWYEGENYHFFAHRGLWYCMQLASRIDAEIPPDLARRYDVGFRAPFLTTLPDLTFPSRRDSQYAVSLRQWRFAEMCELGLARGDDRILRGMLARLHADDIPRLDTGRWKSTAEAERNLPAVRLDRSDLGWKSLLFARPELEVAESAPLPSVLLEGQGIGVIRRDAGRVYIALDYGVSGGGHGHPDRLNLIVSNGDRRVLDDMGTGSYVDPSLHWYRSTLAHNAPMFDGRSQDRVRGFRLAFDDRGAAGWVSARARISEGASATRTLIVMPDYLIDEVAWQAEKDRIFVLPLHFELEGVDGEAGPTTLDGSGGLEDGFRFLRDSRRIMLLPAGRLAHFVSTDGNLSLSADSEVEIWKAIAPGPPGAGDRSMMLLRSKGAAGTLRWMWRWTGDARADSLFPSPIVTSGPERHEHLRTDHGWQVAIHVGGAKSTIDLEGLAEVVEIVGGDGQGEGVNTMQGPVLEESKPYRFHLGEAQYHRSEESWIEAGSPTADGIIERVGDWIQMRIVVRAERTFASPDAENALDNENADINGAGLQLYLQADRRRAGYVIVPRPDHGLSIRPIDGCGSEIMIEGRWEPVDDGYEVDLRFQPRSKVTYMNLIVNEKPAGRARRRGQLVLGGDPGEFIYLRGDRCYGQRIPLFLRDD